MDSSTRPIETGTSRTLPRRSARWAAPMAAMALVLGGGCGGGGAPGPTGSAEEVVRAAPDASAAAGRVGVDAAGPDAESTGTLDLRTGVASLRFGGTVGATPPPEVTDPGAVLDLIRGAVDIHSYGGQAIRGVATFRYEAVVNVERALATVPASRRPALEALTAKLGVPAFYVDVWVDGGRRIRRIQVPVAKTTQRPSSRDRAKPDLITVDYFDYPEPG